MSRTKLTTDVWHHKGVAVFTLIRGLAAVSILTSPLWGFIASVILDILDGRFLLTFGHLDKLAYDLWDKVLDTLTFLAELAVVVKTNLSGLFWALFLYRMVGHIFFWTTKRPNQLIFFPNLFETAFFWFLIPTTYYVRWLTPFGALYLLFVLKMSHEVILHLLWPKYGGRKWKKFLERLFGSGSLPAEFFSGQYP